MNVKAIVLVLVGLAMLMIPPGLYAADVPLGYPYSSWGEVGSYFGSDQVKGLRIDGYFEQGVDWTKIPGTNWVLDTFVGLRFTESGQAADYWDHKLGPWFGLKMKRDFTALGDWGQVSLGVRGEYYKYTSGPFNDDLRGVGFVQWSFGGNWKK